MHNTKITLTIKSEQKSLSHERLGQQVLKTLQEAGFDVTRLYVQATLDGMVGTPVRLK